MPRNATYPLLFDECKRITITFLKKHKYLGYNQHFGGNLSFSSNGVSMGTISIAVNTQAAPAYLELSYSKNGKPFNYKVRLIRFPSNLGVGDVWYFVCPVTGKWCRNLYLVGDYFLHREAFKGCFYEKQLQSKTWRQLDKVYVGEGEWMDLCDKRYKKYFKTHYAGKPTKKYIKLTRQIDYAERHSMDGYLEKYYNKQLWDGHQQECIL